MGQPSWNLFSHETLKKEGFQQDTRAEKSALIGKKEVVQQALQSKQFFSLVMQQQKAFLLSRPRAATNLSLKLPMYLRIQCRNEGLRLKYTKIQNLNIYTMKKKLKCTRYIIHTQLVHLASWRKWELRYSHPKEQVNITVLAQNGVGMSLEAAGLQLFPQPPLLPVITTQHLGQFSAFYPKKGL